MIGGQGSPTRLKMICDVAQTNPRVIVTGAVVGVVGIGAARSPAI